MVGGVVAVVGAVAADVRGEKGVVVSTEQAGGLQWTLQCIVCWYFIYPTLALQDYGWYHTWLTC